VRHIGGPALRQNIDELEIGEGPDDRKKGGDQNHPADRRDRDMEESVPGVCAVDGGCLVQFVRNRLEPSQNRDAEKRNAAPDIGQTDGGDGQLGIAQKVNVLCNQSQRLQEP